MGDYLRYRPDYPRAVLETIEERGLGTHSRVADIGAGTGIFSALLLESGAEVVAVEPNPAMRAAADECLGSERRYRSVEGSAEETGLPTGAFDLVAAAQAFHWFQAERAASEFQRILRPGGLVALVWNSRREASTPFLADYEALLKRYATDYGSVNHRHLDAARIRRFFPGAVEFHTFPHAQSLDREGIRGRLLSSSYTPPEGSPRRGPMLHELDEIFEVHAEGGSVRIEYDTELYIGPFG